MKATENYRAQKVLEDPTFKFDGFYTIESDGTLTKGSNSYAVSVSGDAPTGGTLSFVNHVVAEGCIEMKAYAVKITNGETKSVTVGSCNGTEVVEDSSSSSEQEEEQETPTNTDSAAVALLKSISITESAIERTDNGLVQIVHTVPSSYAEQLANDLGEYRAEKLISDEEVQADRMANTSLIIDYRYMGENPDNYIYFNCQSYLQEDQNDSTCEVWRILGIDEHNRIRIVSYKPISRERFNSNSSVAWGTSTLYSYLNDYYNGTSTTTYTVATTYSTCNPDDDPDCKPDPKTPVSNGLTAASRSLVATETMYSGEVQSYAYNSAADAYEQEHGITHSNGTYSYSAPTITTGKVGLLTVSDYLYTAKSCYKYTGYDCYSWLTDQDSTKPFRKSAWLRTPESSSYVFTIQEDYGNFRIDTTSLEEKVLDVYPTVTLTSNFSLVGNGTYNSPYKIVSSNSSL